VIKKLQRRRPRPDLGCRAIGCMDLAIIIGIFGGPYVAIITDGYGDPT
jgi:hypothetical protein